MHAMRPNKAKIQCSRYSAYLRHVALKSAQCRYRRAAGTCVNKAVAPVQPQTSTVAPPNSHNVTALTTEFTYSRAKPYVDEISFGSVHSETQKPVLELPGDGLFLSLATGRNTSGTSLTSDSTGPLHWVGDQWRMQTAIPEEI